MSRSDLNLLSHKKSTYPDWADVRFKYKTLETKTIMPKIANICPVGSFCNHSRVFTRGEDKNVLERGKHSKKGVGHETVQYLTGYWGRNWEKICTQNHPIKL